MGRRTFVKRPNIVLLLDVLYTMFEFYFVTLIMEITEATIDFICSINFLYVFPSFMGLSLNCRLLHLLRKPMNWHLLATRCNPALKRLLWIIYYLFIYLFIWWPSIWGKLCRIPTALNLWPFPFTWSYIICLACEVQTRGDSRRWSAGISHQYPNEDQHDLAVGDVLRSSGRASRAISRWGKQWRDCINKWINNSKSNINRHL